MKNQNLTFRFHDPNPPGAAAEHILKVFMEVNAPKVEQAIRAAMAAGEPDEAAYVSGKTEAVEEGGEAVREEEGSFSQSWEMTMAV